MKKNNIDNLFVVEVNEEDMAYYVICKYSNILDNYYEIFTGRIIKVDDITIIEPLNKCYPMLEHGDNDYHDTDKLANDEILQLLLTINQNVGYYKGKDNNEDINSILDKATLSFFPKNGRWSSNCFQRDSDLLMGNLPCHLRDNIWLAKMLKYNNKLLYISTKKVLDYIENSELFNQKRREYEDSIVSWQIKWMIGGGDNWITDPQYGGDFINMDENYDIGFRKGIVDTLSSIGMNKEVIEEGIEKNADIWRDIVMIHAFYNKYRPSMICADFSGFFGGKKDETNNKVFLEEIDPEFKDKWLKMRRYEYYQRHKDIIDKYGSKHPDMMLNDKEVEELRKYLAIKHQERMEQLERYEENNKKLRYTRKLRRDNNDLL